GHAPALPVALAVAARQRVAHPAGHHHGGTGPLHRGADHRQQGPRPPWPRYRGRRDRLEPGGDPLVRAVRPTRLRARRLGARPPPPLAALWPPGAAVPRRPYYSLYTPLPYVDDSGPENFKADIPGEGIVGVKARLAQPKGARPGVALSFEVKYPLSQSLRDLQSGSGTGAIDTRLGGTFEWRGGNWTAVYSTGFTRVGQPPLPDRFFEIRQGSVHVSDQPLVLPDRLDLGVGLRRGLGPRLSLVGEITTVLEVGRRTPALDPAWPIDLLGGAQFRSGPLRLTAAARYHGHDLPSM